MKLNSEIKVDGVVIVLMLLYGIAVVGSSPILAIAAWLISGLLILRHTVEPFGEFVNENQLLFMIAMLIILTAGFLLS